MLERIDTYLDQAPRVASQPEQVGPFTLFVPTGPWNYYARPTLGRGGEVTEQDIRVLTARQRELGVRVSIEWVAELAPGLGETARAVGLAVGLMPLMVLRDEPRSSRSSSVAARTRVLGAGDESLPAALAAVEIAFRPQGSAADIEAMIRGIGGRIEFTRTMIASGHQVVVAAEVDGVPVAAGTAVPRGSAAELVGLGTMPEWRRRGIGAAVIAALIGAVRERGVELVLLSAGDDDVARLYGSLGFVRVGTAGEARAAR